MALMAGEEKTTSRGGTQAKMLSKSETGAETTEAQSDTEERTCGP